MPDPNKKLDDINITGITPTANDSIQAYMHQVIPDAAKGQINSLNPDLLNDAKKSHELTGDMTYEDFKNASNSLGLDNRTDLMKHLTGKTPKDLNFIKRGVLNTFVDMDKQLKKGGQFPDHNNDGDITQADIYQEKVKRGTIQKEFGGDVKGIGGWSGKSVPGMIKGRHK